MAVALVRLTAVALRTLRAVVLGKPSGLEAIT
jgi:hypothetical protein